MLELNNTKLNFNKFIKHRKLRVNTGVLKFKTVHNRNIVIIYNNTIKII